MINDNEKSHVAQFGLVGKLSLPKKSVFNITSRIVENKKEGH